MPQSIGTWIAPSLGGKAVRLRLLLLGCILCGLIQKPLIAFAWDVQALQEVIQSVARAKASPSLLGGTAILLRQVFAVKGQTVVGDIALALAGSGCPSWNRKSLQRLLSKLLELSPEDAGKRRGRMSQFTGPAWLRRILVSHASVKAFCAAAKIVGELFASSLEESTFHDACAKLKTKHRMPMVGSYSVPHLLRACVVARFSLDGVQIHISESAWTSDLRPMHVERTASIFDRLAVHSYQDAMVMLRTVVGMVRNFYSFRTAAAYGSASLVDLPCQACELGSLVSVVCSHLKPPCDRSTHARGGGGRGRVGASGGGRPLRGTHARGVGRASVRSTTKKGRSTHARGNPDPIVWLLKRLPGDTAGMRELSKNLKAGRAAVGGKGNGLDLQAAAVVTRDWLQSDPQPLKSSLWHCIHAGGVPFDLPGVACSICEGPLEHKERQVFCADCFANKRRVADKERQAKKRRSH